jgi:hypothetical protein
VKRLVPALLRKVRILSLLAALPLSAGTGVYVVKSAISQGAFALGLDTASGNKIILVAVDRKDKNQQWTLAPSGSGSTLRHVGTGKMLLPGPVGGQPSRGTQAMVFDLLELQQDPLAAKKATWEISAPERGQVTIRQQLNTSLHLDAFGDGAWKAGTKVGLWSWNGNVNQWWILEELNEDEVAKDAPTPGSAQGLMNQLGF